MGAFLGGSGQRSWPWACLPEPATQVTTRRSTALVQFFTLTFIRLLLVWACHLILKLVLKAENVNHPLSMMLLTDYGNPRAVVQRQLRRDGFETK
jgi:hypothetical protein